MYADQTEVSASHAPLGQSRDEKDTAGGVVDRDFGHLKGGRSQRSRYCQSDCSKRRPFAARLSRLTKLRRHEFPPPLSSEHIGLPEHTLLESAYPQSKVYIAKVRHLLSPISVRDYQQCIGSVYDPSKLPEDPSFRISASERFVNCKVVIIHSTRSVIDC